ncbi:hypothetical protein RJ035_008203 [Blastomyces gilchristii]
MNLLARLPSGDRATISDLLVAAFDQGLVVQHFKGNSALFGSSFRQVDAIKMLVVVMFHGYPGIPMDEFINAVAADTCVADEPAAKELERRDGASCMRNQLNLLQPILNRLWDAKTGCPNKVAPKLIRHKGILFPNGLGELGSDPISGANPTEVTQWDKSEGVPDYFWALAQRKRNTYWPSDYFKSSDRELFAETGVAYLYDNSGKTLLERGYDPSCLANGLKALGEHAGSEFQKGSKCFKREPNSKIDFPKDEVAPAAGNLRVARIDAELDGDFGIETFP